VLRHNEDQYHVSSYTVKTIELCDIDVLSLRKPLCMYTLYIFDRDKIYVDIAQLEEHCPR
jgi:hypothetical protein